jgi:DNA-binding SARP family transcriptional activator/predicted ATPase
MLVNKKSPPIAVNDDACGSCISTRSRSRVVWVALPIALPLIHFDSDDSRQVMASMDSDNRDFAIYLFGSPKILQQGFVLNVPRAQTRALLYLLAANLEPVSRARLAYLLWPELPEAASSRHLTNALNHLRRALGEPAAILKRGDTLQLNPDLIWTDVAAFTHLVSDDRTGNVILSTDALQLYQGDFLNGISLPNSPEFDNWVLMEQARLERLFLSTLQNHVLQASASGRLADAVAYAERYLAVDPLSEEIYRQLIQDYGRLGDRAAVQRTYTRCRTVLAEELDVAPLPSTTAAYAAAFASAEVVSQPLRKPGPDSPGAAPQLPFVGQAGALPVLMEAWRQTRTGSGRCVMLSGEPGIGKSRLIEEFLARIGEQVHLLSGACLPAGHLPYQPLLEALRSTFEAGHLPQGVNVDLLGEATRLLPELRTWFDNLPKPQISEPIHSRISLYHALEQLVQSYSNNGRTVVLVLDDLQWADTALLDWLVYLAPKLQKQRLLLLAAYDYSESPQMQRLLDALDYSKVLMRCHLKPLTSVDIHQLLHCLPLTSKDEQALPDRLHQLCGGNPLYLREIIRAMQESGRWPDAVTRADLSWLPNSLHTVIQKRIERVDSLGMQMLQAAAVCGETFDFDLVMHAAGRSEEESIAALDELLARQLIVESGVDYRFQHEVVRSVVYDGLSSGRRRLLHRRIAAILESRYSYQTYWDQHPSDGRPVQATLSHLAPPALVAHHFQEAGESGRAAEYLVDAGRNAFGVLAFAESIRYAQHGLQMLAKAPSSPARDRLEVQLLTLLGNATATAYGTAAPETAQAFDRARGLLQHMGEISGLFPILSGLAIYYFTRADLSAADELCAKLESLAESEPSDVHLLMSQTLRGLVSYFQGHLSKALQCFEKAYGLYDLDHHSHLSKIYGYDPALFCLCYSAGIHILCGRATMGLSRIDNALSLAEKIGQPYLKNSVHYYQAICYHHLRHTQLARQQAELVLAKAQEEAYPAQMVLASLIRGWARALQGEASLGLDDLSYALATLEKVGAAIGRPLYLSMLAEAYAGTGQYEEARRALAEALTLVQERGERFWQAELERLYGDMLAASESTIHDAEMWYRRALATARAVGAVGLELRAASSYARLVMHTDQNHQAALLLSTLLQNFDSSAAIADVQAARQLHETLRSNR